MDQHTLRELSQNCQQTLLNHRTSDGHWIGALSSSALSTATAVFTLSLYHQSLTKLGQSDSALNNDLMLIQAGLKWLADHQNDDGGWGDTTKSFSNISTTCLGWAVMRIPEAKGYVEVARRAEDWIERVADSTEARNLSNKLAERYGKDRTFSVPIMTMLALSGRLGSRPWRWIPGLPFELASLPFWCFQVIRLPVVSYALPALIAMGQLRHFQRPSWNPVLRMIRWAVKQRTLRKLRDIQPTTGGYLEATPLTSFVSMSLIGAGQCRSEVVQEGLRFLRESALPDGSWPIDTNLATWVTTLSVNALGGVPEPETVQRFLLSQQYRQVHPYTQAPPGGWAWTNLSGGVPDADDTPSALLALAKLGDADDTVLSAVEAAVVWLLNLQNSDGGIPTFCKGWGALPFDRSSNDLTAHALLAWATWQNKMPDAVQKRIGVAQQRACQYLLKQQNADGSWAPLWFGNQHAPEVANLTYGTSRVLRISQFSQSADMQLALTRGRDFLLQTQNEDGGWGGRNETPSSIEETALALEGLAIYQHNQNREPRVMKVLERAIEYLHKATDGGQNFPASPIGFYFANLWYYEKLYPIIYTVAALKACEAIFD